MVVAQVIEEFGTIDVLVNNAAEQHPRDSIEDISSEQLEGTFRINIFSYFFLTKAALPHLAGRQLDHQHRLGDRLPRQRPPDRLLRHQRRGGLVHPLAGPVAGPEGIRVNGVAPGPVWTPLIPSTFPPDKVATFGSDTPLGRAGEPSEIAPELRLPGVLGSVLHHRPGDPPERRRDHQRLRRTSISDPVAAAGSVACVSIRTQLTQAVQLTTGDTQPWHVTKTTSASRDSEGRFTSDDQQQRRRCNRSHGAAARNESHGPQHGSMGRDQSDRQRDEEGGFTSSDKRLPRRRPSPTATTSAPAAERLSDVPTEKPEAPRLPAFGGRPGPVVYSGFMKIKRFSAQGFRAFDQVELDFSAGRTFALVGVNGAGKTSILDGLAIALSRLEARVPPATVAAARFARTTCAWAQAAGLKLEVAWQDRVAEWRVEKNLVAALLAKSSPSESLADLAEDIRRGSSGMKIRACR